MLKNKHIKNNLKLEWWQLLGNCLITATVGASLLAPKVQAAAPTVTVDETAYVMLDYYGQTQDISVVKACNLNGNTEFSDNGNYDKVINMSTLDEPQLNSTGLTWILPDSAPQRFYYQVVPQNQTLNLPWNIDVSYKLNGVPTHAEDLAGQSGLISITVAVTPNENIDEYFRHNFILAGGMMIDSAKDYSFNAPGTQLQTLGNYQLAFFVAMPAEETEFNFEIGTDSFENNGIMLAMMPATLKQLDQMGEIRDHKENLEAAGNAIDRTFDDIFSIMTAMTGGINQTVSGLSQLEETRAAIYQAQTENEAAANSMVSSINDLTDKVNAMDNLQTDQAFKDINSNYSDNIWIERTNQALSVGDSSKGMVNNLSTFANAMKKTLSENNDGLNEGAKQTLQGMTNIMTNLGSAMDKTASLQKNKNTIANITRDEWQRLDDELNIINIDTQAEKKSLTGDNNIEPRSLQIILRTQEISLNETQVEPLLDTTAETSDVVQRLKTVFAQIGATFTNWSK